MFKIGDLFQWERFITPSIIKLFYWLAVAITILSGLSGVISSLRLMASSPFAGFIMGLSYVAAVLVGVIFARIAAEFVLIVFRINEHLGAIRNRGGM
jgi:predicted ABC-type sugar transport system permease subunit